ncbi:sodium-dependent nutrient amino acid transporter 1 isoform X1 [Euwallacea similis]|uniref:sodium-dependent nutrient amino acid transporter 1 isoform X1 n=1 Tax=Euwallacea similis TaxID=1736056 RepID=UPI00344DA5D2
MKEIWDGKEQLPRLSDGQPVAKKWNITDTLPKRKGLSHSPSLRAIRNYIDLPIDRNSGIENPGYDNDYKYEYYMHPDFSNFPTDFDSNSADFEYPTISTKSINTSHSGGSEDYADNEMGSSVKLVTEKVERSCKTWCAHLSTAICTISIAAGLGTLYRLPQSTLIKGGFPFLVAYAIVSVIFGLPLLFLELGIGQLAQEGFIKSWRAVPFFKGVGYVKLLAGCLLSLYYSLYMGLALMYMIWVVKEPFPFSDCANGVIMTKVGYTANAKNGQQCVADTFLKSPFEDPYYFGIYTALLLFIWIVVIILSIRRTKSYIRSLLILFFPTMACYIALTTKSVLLEAELGVLYKFFEEADWSLLGNAEVWYYATIQVFFSTNVGFGSFITNAGIMYNKVNPLWTALGYIVTNLIFGTGSVLISHLLTANASNLTHIASSHFISEVRLFTMIYDSAVNHGNDNFRYWTIAAYLFFVFAGFLSMATLTYTMLKAIYGHDGIRFKWWQTSIIFSFSGFVLSCALLLKPNFLLVRLLDEYVVGNLIFICVILEVLAFICFYGTSRIQSDFEFMLGHILSKIWLFMWWIIPLVLTGILLWGLAVIYLEEMFSSDPVWLYGIGWAVVLTTFLLIIAMGLVVLRKQDGYTVCDKLKASLEPSQEWGPKDPMLRYNWVQWNTKSQSGERDFTLKRRGTKEYTKTIRKRAKKEALSMGVEGAYTKSEGITVTINNNVDMLNGNSRPSSKKYNSKYYVSSSGISQITSGEDPQTDAADTKHHHHHLKHHHHHRNSFPVNTEQPQDNEVIRHSVPVTTNIKIVDDANSEGYGTFRNKGPYIIDGDIGHVCHRRYGSNEHEAITQL